VSEILPSDIQSQKENLLAPVSHSREAQCEMGRCDRYQSLIVSELRDFPSSSLFETYYRTRVIFLSESAKPVEIRTPGMIAAVS
jgi:hypothetical protein